MTFPTDALKFLTAIFPEDIIDDSSRINFRGLARGAAAQERFVPSIASLNANGTGHAIAGWNENEGRSVYVAPGVRRGSDGTKDGVLGIPALWVDIDAKAILGIKDRPLTLEEREEGKARARRILAERLPAALQPSIIVDTGGGLQAWWLLKEFARISDDDTVARLEGYLKGLARHLGADPAVAQLAALMRVPGFVNHKYPDAPAATIREFDPDRRFQPSDFADYFIERPTDHARASRPEAEVIPEGQRNDPLFKFGRSRKAKGRSGVSSDQRFTRDNPCPICGGGKDDPQHQGIRCHGFISGAWAHCSREEWAGTLPRNENSGTAAHHLGGRCGCGRSHQFPTWWQPRITKYEIKDVHGDHAAVHVRKDFPDGEKEMFWEQPDGTPGLGGRPETSLPLYGIDEVVAAPADEPVIIVEGEKARDALTARGILAVATVTGAKTTHDRDAFRPLLGRRVILWPDNDEDGRRHMEQTAKALQEIG